LPPIVDDLKRDYMVRTVFGVPALFVGPFVHFRRLAAQAAARTLLSIATLLFAAPACAPTPTPPSPAIAIALESTDRRVNEPRGSNE